MAKKEDWEKKARRAYLLLVDQGTRIEAMKRLLVMLRDFADETQKPEIDRVIGPERYVDIYAEELLGYFVEQGLLEEGRRDEMLDNLRGVEEALRELVRDLSTHETGSRNPGGPKLPRGETVEKGI